MAALFSLLCPTPERAGRDVRGLSPKARFIERAKWHFLFVSFECDSLSEE